MMASLFAGVSGLRNHQTRMNVIGNNIANVNTIGYKTSRVTFSEALVQDFKGAGRPTEFSGGTNPVQLGLGMQVSTIDNLFQQGGLESTGQVTDLAIQGSGFFVLRNNTGVFYTRNGAFNFDADSNLVDPSSGLYVQGRMADNTGQIEVARPIGNITVPFGQQDPARATTEITLANNLDATATDSEATLTSSGTSNISIVNGEAANGAGGVHTLSITGTQATRSTFQGTNIADDGTGNPGAILSANMTLSSLGVTDASGFTISRDNGARSDVITGLTVNSTVGDLVAAINEIDDLEAELVDILAGTVIVGREVQIRRTVAGAGTDFNFETNASQVTLDGNGVPQTNPATASTFTGTNTTGAPLTLATTLASINAAIDTTGLQISVDGGVASPIDLSGFATPTIGDLITTISAIPGVTASLTPGGEVQVTRDNTGSAYSITLTDNGGPDILSEVFGQASPLAVNNGTDADINNIVGVVFGVADGATLLGDNGSDHTFAVSDVFQPNGGVQQPPVSLGVYVDPNDGLAKGVTGLGGGGVTIRTPDTGLLPGTAVIETEDTIHSTSITVYDSQGGTHAMTVSFTKSHNQNEWNWTASFNGNETITSGGSGVVRFDTDGSLLSFTYNGGASGLTFNPNTGAGLATVDINPGSIGLTDGLTGFAGTNSASIMSQDGYGVGVLDKISIDQSGNIYGIFTNGVSRVLAQIAVADFNNVAGLDKSGDSLWRSTANSGESRVGVAGETIAGSISSGALEASTVDISQEFTSMITAQRGFQANARIITTSDSMLDELVNLKR